MATANGKIILLGEHAVVYGSPAIAAGIRRGASASATHAQRARLTLGERVAHPEDGTDLGRAFAALLAALAAPPCELRVELELPAGCGLGASAAIGVAAARAVFELTAAPTAERSTAAIERAALAWETVFHGNPSGIDTAAALHDGCITFTREAGAQPLSVGRELSLVVAIAGPAASTKLMVDSVAKLRERRPEVVARALDGIATLVRNAKLCIEAGDVHGLGKLMDLNQMLLSGLFVSTEGIENACHLARQAGALGAKLTGAGGGGAVIALASDDPSPITRAWQTAGLQTFTTTVSATSSEPAARGRV